MRWKPAAAATVALIAALASTSTAQAANTRTVQAGSCRAAGEFAACTASGTVDAPYSLLLRVRSAPGQQVSGTWTVTCTESTGAGTRTGTFNGATPLRRRLHMPFYRPASCTVTATAALAASGSVRVLVTARVPA